MAKKKTLQLQVESEDLTVPQDRIEGFLAKAAGLVGTMPEGQFSRLERYLAIIAAGGGGGGAPIDSPTFTGVPKAPTAEKGTNTTQIATTQFVQTAIGDKQDTLNYATAEVNRLLGLVNTADDVADAGVAPGGFGLGGVAQFFDVSNTSPDIIDKTGFYLCDLGGVYDWCYVLHIEHQTSGTCAQYAHNVNNGSLLLRRKNNNVFTPWEWVNPRMLENVEYRTTERFLGKPVYVKAFSGLGPGTGSASRTIYLSISETESVQDVIQCTATISGGYTLPYGSDYTNEVIGAIAKPSTGVSPQYQISVVIFRINGTTVDWSNSTIKGYVKYTKTND